MRELTNEARIIIRQEAKTRLEAEYGAANYPAVEFKSLCEVLTNAYQNETWTPEQELN